MVTAGEDGVFKCWNLEKIVEANKQGQGRVMGLGTDTKNDPMFLSLDNKYNEDAQEGDDIPEEDRLKEISSVAISEDLRYVAMSQDVYITVFDVKGKFEEYARGGLPLSGSPVAKAERKLKFKVEDIASTDHRDGKKNKVNTISNISFGNIDGEHALFVATISGVKCYNLKRNLQKFAKQVQSKVDKDFQFIKANVVRVCES